jgi:enoyl-CoA hydratase/carnithine racemase
MGSISYLSVASARTVLRTERHEGGVVALSLDRPDKRNALDADLTQALLDFFAAPDARVIVIGSTDQRWFCSGADLSLADDDRARVSDDLYELYGRMLATPAPIIAAIPGPAVGGGAQLALASDLRIGSASTSFRFVGAGHGLAVGAWGLPSLVGRGRALDLCLTMRALGADEALAIGLLDRVEDDPRGAALALADSLATLDATAVARIKHVVRGAACVDTALDEERTQNRESWSGSVAGLAPAPVPGPPR